ncbi:conserved Plasmodium protein, unknown function [Plasmodium malariae]|uniref:Uncharacterized protein n=1 Tax=Plasmodium malariae TaxID=5858 RepID=A0A1C3KEP8_PLAMA|nr:conserved Plasmodium protein, unknown function [Plasmodium malariae]
MGNIVSEQKRKPLTLLELSTKIGEYRTINEGDPEMVEDPDFPKNMMNEALNNNTTIDGNSVQGTFVYYPNKRKPKMWIGNYKILNPEDILCANVAEKIGMTEMEWKNYIKRKKREQEDESKVVVDLNFDYPFREETNSLKEIFKKENIEFPYRKNDNLVQRSDSEFIGNSLHVNEEYEKLNDHDSYVYSHNKNCVTSGHGFFEDVYYDMTSENEGGEGEEVKEKYMKKEKEVKEEKYMKKEKNEKDAKERVEDKNELLNNSYINKLNKDITKFNLEQEQIIQEKRKDIYAYSSTNTSHLIVPQKNGSFLMKNVDPRKYDKKNIIEELINENKNKINSKIYSLKQKKREQYANLSSLSTKESLEIKKSNNKDNISKNKIYLSKTLVK